MPRAKITATKKKTTVKKAMGKTVTKVKTVVKSRKKRLPAIAAGPREYTQAQLVEIQERAYYIWVHKGRPENTHDDNWIEAEAELKAEKII
ncbi:MAG: DUF2934 domain-containing protein [bacterium]